MSTTVENTPAASDHDSEKAKKSNRKSSFITKLFRIGRSKKSSSKLDNTPGLSGEKYETPSNSNDYSSVSHNHKIDPKVVRVLNFKSEVKRSTTLPNGSSTLSNGSPATPTASTQPPSISSPKILNLRHSSPTKSGINANLPTSNSPSKNHCMPTNYPIDNYKELVIGNLSLSNTSGVTNGGGVKNSETSIKHNGAFLQNTPANENTSNNPSTSHNIPTENNLSQTYSKAPDNSILIHYTTTKDVRRTHSINKNNSNININNNNNNNEKESSIPPTLPNETKECSVDNEYAINHMNMHNLEPTNQEAYVKVDLVTYNKLLSDLNYFKTQLAKLQQLLT